MESERVPSILAVSRIGDTMEMLIFLAGTMVGAMVGVATMCLLQIKK